MEISRRLSPIDRVLIRLPLTKQYLAYENWYNTKLKTIAPPSAFYIGGMWAIAHFTGNEIFVNAITVLAITMMICGAIAKFAPLKRLVNKNIGWVVALWAPFAWLIASPAFAQLVKGDSCSGAGIFSPAAKFVAAVFANFAITSSSAGGLPQWICAFMATVMVVTIIGFVLMALMVTLRVAQGQLTEILNPILGFMFFIFFTSTAIAYLIGAN